MSRVRDYHQYFWFHDPLFLADSMGLHWHKCKHDPLPRRGTEAWEEVDHYFLEEMKLEKKGWQSFSLADYSPFELAAIREWVSARPKTAWMAQETPGQDVYALIGTVNFKTTCVVVQPQLITEFDDFMGRFSRPCLLVTNKDFREVIPLLPENHRIVEGWDATAVSFDFVPMDRYRYLYEHLV